MTEDCPPPEPCSETQSCPDASSGPSSPDAHYSDNIASLRRARPGIVIEIRWCPAHKGITG